MKKLIFIFMTIAALSFGSCGNRVTSTKAADTDTVMVDSIDSVDSDSSGCDITIEESDSLNHMLDSLNN